MATSVFINEIHYDNSGADTGEGIEIAGPAGTDLTGWNLVLYNGNNQQVYDTISLSGIILDQSGGFGTLSFLRAGIQNGAPDGIALVDDSGTVVQFLSYEGAFTASGGPADGLLSTDIGVSEAGSTAVGDSLQLSGIGTMAEDFTWQAASDDNFGAANTGQIFADPTGGPYLTIDDVALSEGDAGATVFSFTVTRSGDLTGATDVDWTLQNVTTDDADFVVPQILAGTVSFAVDQDTTTIEVEVQGDVDREPSETFAIELSNPTNGAVVLDDRGDGTIVNDELTPISEIQGAGHVSPFVTLDLTDLPAGAFTVLGDEVATTGIVTAVDNNGFYLQDPVGDGDDATSDAIFVSTGSTPAVDVGDGVTVSGMVAEVFPGGTASRNLPTTHIVSPTVAVTSSGNDLPAAVIIGAGGRQVPTDEIDDDGFASFDHTDDGIDFFESLEGMRVTATDLVAIAPTNRFGEIFTVSDNGDGATGLSERGSLNISPEDFNPEKIQIDTDSTVSAGIATPQVDAGATLTYVTGVVSYGFGNFEIIPTEAFSVVTPSTLAPEVTDIAGSENQLVIASYNVLNLDPNEDDGDTDIANGQFAAIADDIVNNLGTPDIIALQEVQDNSGSANDGVIAADETLQALIDAIDLEDDGVINGSSNYAYIDNTFIGDVTSGGQPGGNIRTAFLYRTDRVDLVEGSVQSIQDGDQQTNPDNPFFGSRLPLVATFAFNGEEVTVVNNHFSSKGGSAPILGTEQPFEDGQEDPTINGSLDERQAQANAVNDFVEGRLADAPFENIVVTGDFNEFEFISPIQTLEGSLTNLVSTEITEDERYSFNFQGNSQQLDHMLISDALQFDAAFDIAHVNTEFTGAGSDHDPLVTALTVESLNEIAGTDGRDFLFGTRKDDMILGLDGKDTILAGRGNDKVAGGDGKDLILAGDGDDQVLGGADKDKIFGNRGNDKIEGGAGDDFTSGGLGDDMFVFNFAPDEGFGDDIIPDFALGDNKIVLKNASEEDEAAVADAIADSGFGKTVIDFGDTGSITVYGPALTEDDFIFI